MKKFASNKKVFSLIGSLWPIKRNLFKICCAFRRNTAQQQEANKASETADLHAIDACKLSFSAIFAFRFNFS